MALKISRTRRTCHDIRWFLIPPFDTTKRRHATAEIRGRAVLIPVCSDGHVPFPPEYYDGTEIAAFIDHELPPKAPVTVVADKTDKTAATLRRAGRKVTTTPEAYRPLTDVTVHVDVTDVSFLKDCRITSVIALVTNGNK